MARRECESVSEGSSLCRAWRARQVQRPELRLLDVAQLNLEHPLVEGTDRITPEQPDHCTHGEVGAKRDF
jgi:hypothetical protein